MRRNIPKIQQSKKCEYCKKEFMPSLNLIIEADGDYWHKLDRIKKKDKAENAYLKKCGFNLMRWRGADILNDINNLSKQLDNYS